jgi:hypothetical protein
MQKTFESYLESELTPIGMSDKKTIERALWYYRTYFKPNEENIVNAAIALVADIRSKPNDTRYTIHIKRLEDAIKALKG